MTSFIVIPKYKYVHIKKGRVKFYILWIIQLFNVNLCFAVISCLIKSLININLSTIP